MEFRWSLLLMVTLFMTGCESNDSANTPVGVCIHTYEDEVLHIDEAFGKTTGSVIGQIDLSSFAVNGVTRSVESIIQQRSSNVTLVGETLRCTLPCSFGTESGSWEFSVVAPGYVPTGQIIEVSYSTFSGGCPSYEDVGTHTTVIVNESV